MKTYTIPQTDIHISRLAYGTWHLGGSWNHEPPTQDIKDRALRLLQTAADQGITLIDLADIYTKGKSDSVVGYALSQDKSLRDKFILQEKCGIKLADEPEGTPGRYDFSYDNIVGSLETSLERLGTDRVELLLLHRPDPLIEPEEVARAFDDLHSSGKVRYFGVSNHTPMQIELLKKYVDQPLVINQIQLSLLHNDLIMDGIVANMARADYTGARGTLDYCRLHDIQIQAWSPVAGGNLFNPSDDDPEHIHRTSALLNELADTHSTSPGAIALAWLLRHPAGIVPILGTMNPQRIVDSCEADNVQLSREDWYRLLEAANNHAVP